MIEKVVKLQHFAMGYVAGSPLFSVKRERKWLFKGFGQLACILGISKNQRRDFNCGKKFVTVERIGRRY